MEMNESVEKYLELFEIVTARVGDGQVACEIVNQVGKDSRCAQMAGRPGRDGNTTVDGDETPATSKQIGYLKRLGVVVPEGVTNYQASELIDQAMAR